LTAGTSDEADGVPSDKARINAKKKAILSSIGLDPDTPTAQEAVQVVERHDGEVSVTSSSDAQAAMWKRKVVAFRTTAVKMSDSWVCSAIALTDD